MINHWPLNLKNHTSGVGLDKSTSPNSLCLHWPGHLPSFASPTFFASSQGLIEYYKNISKVNSHKKVGHLPKNLACHLKLVMFKTQCYIFFSKKIILLSPFLCWHPTRCSFLYSFSLILHILLIQTLYIEDFCLMIMRYLLHILHSHSSSYQLAPVALQRLKIILHIIPQGLFKV